MFTNSIPVQPVSKRLTSVTIHESNSLINNPEEELDFRPPPTACLQNFSSIPAHIGLSFLLGTLLSTAAFSGFVLAHCNPAHMSNSSTCDTRLIMNSVAIVIIIAGGVMGIAVMLGRFCKQR